jgi:hypothetical protein
LSDALTFLVLGNSSSNIRHLACVPMVLPLPNPCHQFLPVPWVSLAFVDDVKAECDGWFLPFAAVLFGDINCKFARYIIATGEDKATLTVSPNIRGDF